MDWYGYDSQVRMPHPHVAATLANDAQTHSLKGADHVLRFQGGYACHVRLYLNFLKANEFWENIALLFFKAEPDHSFDVSISSSRLLPWE